MELTVCQVLRLHLQPPQSLLVPLQVEEVEADCGNMGEHLGREQIGDQQAAGRVESTGTVQENRLFI